MPSPDPTPVTFARITRDVVRADGPDTIGFLQGQLSQDVAGLPVGASAWSFVLQPQGKVDAWLRVHRTGESSVAIDVDPGWGAVAKARLERFKLRTKCELVLDEGVPTVAVRGIALEGGLACGWPGVTGSDHIGLADPPADLPAGARELDRATFDALRIAAGVPAMGAELTDVTIPGEAGQWVIDASVSFTKGCYTGQELVARIDSRGNNVPRLVRGFTADAPGPVPGAAIVVDGAEVGVVTSVGIGPAGVVGLCSVKRAVELPVGATAGESVVRLVAVPAG